MMPVDSQSRYNRGSMRSCTAVFKELKRTAKDWKVAGSLPDISVITDPAFWAVSEVFSVMTPVHRNGQLHWECMDNQLPLACFSASFPLKNKGIGR